jgi:SRSO17 transposase
VAAGRACAAIRTHPTHSLAADITALDLTYVAGILSTTTVWLPGTAPLPPKRWSGRGRPTTRLRGDARHQPVSVTELALGLSKRAWRRIEWREGSAEPLASRFARLRILCGLRLSLSTVNAIRRSVRNGVCAL